MDFIILAILLGIIPAYIAKNKGKDFVTWWFYGALLFIVALPHSLMMKGDVANIEKDQLNQGMQKCPFCAELIKGEAKVCRYCNNKLV